MITESLGGDPKKRERPEDPFNFAAHDVADELFLSPLMILKDFLYRIEDGAVLFYNPDPSCVFDPASDRNAKAGREKFLDDSTVMREALTHFNVIHGSIGLRPFADEISTELLEIFEVRKISWTIIFAPQVFLDIKYVLQENVARAFPILNSTGDAITCSLKQHFKVDKDLIEDARSWSRQKEQRLFRIIERVELFM